MRGLERGDEPEPAHALDILLRLRAPLSASSPSRAKAVEIETHQDLRMLDPEPLPPLRPAQLLVVVGVAPVRSGEVPQRALVDVEHDGVGAVADAMRVDLEALHA